MAKKKMRTCKDIRLEIEALPAITNKAAFEAAMPLLIEMNERIETMNHTVDSCKAVAKNLKEACSEYALAHNSIFVNGLVTDGKGVQHGDVDVGGVLYHFASGYGKMIRIDGDDLSQEFLSGLPSGWTKLAYKLSTSAINNLKVTHEELENAGLVRSVNYSWSRPKTITPAEDSE